MSNDFRFLMYQSAEENVSVNAVIKDETIWLSQKGMAELFGCSTDNISLHLKNIFSDGELTKDSVTEKISAGHYKLEAETLGTVGNKYTGLLLPIQTVNGLETAQIAAVLIPAEDGDTTDTLREKYYASIDGEAFGGNVADYKDKTNAITGVGGVKVYPVWNGGGTVKLTIIASDFTAPSAELISKVQTAIDPEQNHGEGLGLAPIGHTVTVTGAKYADLTVAANITFAAGWNWENGKSQLVSAANAYFDELCKEWSENETTIVRISQIETHLLTADCIVDIDGTTINGIAKNVELAADEIPRLKTIGGA